MGSECLDELEIFTPLGRCSILSYGIGHVLNDITSACWFTYLLLFLTDIGLSPRQASIVMLFGQAADGFATIFTGELIDRFGHFKLWHGGGSILVAISFSSVFGGCVLCKIFETTSSTVETIGYSIFAVIFNFGWAATQVSHMSMVNCVTMNRTSRVALTSCRNAFTMVANLSLYAIALAVFSLYHAKTSAEFQYQYRWIAYLSIFIGCCFVTIFLLGTKEPQSIHNTQCKESQRVPWLYWFRKTLYYQVALVYTLTRLITNVSQALLAFYVINDLQMAQTSKALIPGIIYICSFFVSVILQVTGVSMESILVGEILNGCAFVYGSLSFLDKLSCGITLFVLEADQSSPSIEGCNDIRNCQSATRYGSGLIPAACALIGVIVTYTMRLHDIQPEPLIKPLLV